MTFLFFWFYFIAYATSFISTRSDRSCLSSFWLTIAYDIYGRSFHFGFTRILSLSLQYSLASLQLVIVVPGIYFWRFVELGLEFSLSFKWFRHRLLFTCYIFDRHLSKPRINRTVFLLIFSMRCIGPEHRQVNWVWQHNFMRNKKNINQT